MTKMERTTRTAALYLVGAMILPVFQPAFAASPRQISDVGLSITGNLVGQVVDGRGKPVANSPVEIIASGRKPVLTTTNELGYFSVDNLRAGVYVASAPGIAKTVRVWAPRTAPPAASDGLLLVQPERTARAQDQFLGGLLGSRFATIFVATGIVVTTVSLGQIDAYSAS